MIKSKLLNFDEKENEELLKIKNKLDLTWERFVIEGSKALKKIHKL